MHITTNDTTVSSAGAPRFPAVDLHPGYPTQYPKPCTSCDSGRPAHLYGDDPDGFVLCRECRAFLFYCDIGGQG